LEDSLTIILPPETEELARLVAARSGRTLEDVLKEGVEMEARIVGVAVTKSAAPREPARIDRARDIAQRIASRPLLDARAPRAILEQAWAAADDRRR
jgi:antitoxin VapB